jgi:long-subunit fatty acid transport protein
VATRHHHSGSGNYGFESYYHREDSYTISGFNVNLGVLWNITAKWNVGAVVKTPFEANLDHETKEQIYDPEGLIPDEPIPEYQNLNMPLSFGVGLAYRISDRLTASLDLYRTEWDDFYFTDTDGNKVSPITGKPKSESDVDATHQVRAGFEYLHLTNRFIIPVRGGVFYDPAPAEGSPDQFYGFSLGSGIARGRVVFDIAYQFRFGNDVGSFDTGEFDFSEDVREHMIYTSLILHF